MKSLFYLLLFSLFCYIPVSLLAQKEKYTKSIGVYFEIRSDTTNSKRYTEDNEIYKANYIFHYSIEYFDFNGIQKYYKYLNYSPILSERWDFVSKSDSVVIEYRMKVLPDLDIFDRRNKDYDQSVIQYTFWQADGKEQPVSEKTGLVENKKNIWLHPPRTDLTTILQLNPFPCVRLPMKVGRIWRGYLKIGSGWGDERWITWEGKITNKFKYRISGKCTIETELGVLKCYIVKSVAKSTLGKTYLTSYFNSHYGFVRYEYINIDGSQILINLKKVDVK